MKVDAWFCCTLAAQPEKWESFKLRCPIEGVHRVDGLDARKGGQPSWWRSGGAAWGCYQSHLAVLREARDRGLECIGVFEHDAVFREGFWPLLRRVLAEVPDDWGQLYLGGQHLTKPLESTGHPDLVSPRVHRAKNVNRTHGYLIRQPFLTTMIEHLENTTEWNRSFRKGHRPHIDHWMGRLHAKVECVYAARPWLVGQAEGRSDIAAKHLGERWWPLNDRGYAPVTGQTIGVCRGYSERPHTLDKVEEGLKLGGFAVKRLPLIREWGNIHGFIRSAERCDAVVVWNGHEGMTSFTLEMLRQRQIPTVVAENGLLPRKNHLFFDPVGIAGHSSLCGPLDWVSDELVDRGRKMADDFLRWAEVSRAKKPEPICVCPLQNWWDTTVLFSSRFRSMNEFLLQARSLTDLDIVVCPHPKFDNQAKNLELPPGVSVATSGRTIEWFTRASEVIGINSSSLYEAVALGVPRVTALGGCPLRYHETPESRVLLLGALADRQVRYDESAEGVMASCGVRLHRPGGGHTVEGIRS